MMRRFLSVWFPRFPTDRWRRLRPDTAAAPLAFSQRGQGGVRLTALDQAAAALGLRVGMNLADARAQAPELIVVEAEPDADAAALMALADWCGRYSPWCAADGMDGIRLDITGCAHLFDGEAGLAGDLARRLKRFGFTVGVGIADTPAASWGWARYRPNGAGAVLAPGDAEALMGLPVAALRLDADSLDTLRTLGLDSVGTVARLPRGPLGQRLGETVLQRLDRLFGRLAEPISPRAAAESWLARMIFAEPIGRREDIDAVTLRLAERLCRDLSRKGHGARRLELGFYRVDGTVQRLAIGASRPSHTPKHLMRLFAERLETIDPGFGIEAMALEATETEPVTPAQAALSGAGGMDEADLAGLVDRLRNRLGPARVVQLLPVESHMPEHAEIRRPALSFNNKAILPSRFAGGGRTRVYWTPPPKPGRPLKLLPIPEPVTATAPVPDDPPLSFRRGQAVHRVAAADGPERIGPEWWLAGAPRKPRDYYRVEDTEGRRFWLYREGLYGETDPPRWFLHGFFA